MHQLIYFSRNPLPSYFSIEKLFFRIADKIRIRHAPDLVVREKRLPFTSKLNTIYANIMFTRKNQGAINHITGDVHYAILGCNRHNINVLTVHDCVTLQKYSGMNPKYWFIRWFWFHLPVKKSDVVTVISENTKSELVRLTGCKPEKVRVISNFVDPRFRPMPFRFNSAKPTILFIGTTPNKNLDRLTDALKGLPASLDIVGELTEAQRKKLKENSIAFMQSANLTDHELVKKYQTCDLVAFPSTYEGFGLPIIEAQAVGRPVLTSDIAPMRDVAGQGACLINPQDVSSIRRGLENIMSDAAYRETLIAEGFKNVERFRLENIASQYVAIYEEMLEKKLHYKRRRPVRLV